MRSSQDTVATPPVETEAAVAETHVSFVFFVGDRAYKLKKPVTFPFLDFSTRAAREYACHREVDLNRRLAPDVYLGVATVVGPDGTPCEPLVVMRRMPASARLSTLVASGADVDEHLRRIAREMATFHARAETSDRIADSGHQRAIGANWEENLAEMRAFVGRILSEQEVEAVARLARRFIAGHAMLFEQRVRHGRIRDGHGDLLADDIFCLEDGPRILDCIEFNDVFRYADVIADIAFLAMDLERLGRRELADRLLDWYREFSGDAFPTSLADHYIAYRALIRCKVACLRADQGDEKATDEAIGFLRLALARLTHGRAVMVLAGGLPGTGKSTLAFGIAEARGWTIFRSDEIRKDLAGISHMHRPRARFRSDIYTPEMTEATYAEMLDRARRALQMGESVVLDATWNEERFRDAAAAVAAEVHADLVQFRCAVAHAVAAERLRARTTIGADPSDATPSIAREMQHAADPWPDARRIDTTPPVDEVLRGALKALDIPPPPPGGTTAWSILTG